MQQQQNSTAAQWLVENANRIYEDAGVPSTASAVSYVTFHANRIGLSYEMIEPVLQPQIRILDVGGAAGFMGALLHEFFREPFHYEILEGPGASHQKFRVTNLDFDGKSLPYDDQQFDLIICAEVLEHLIIDPYLMIAEINRILRPNGTLFISTPNIASIVATIGLIRGRNPIWNPIRKNIYGRHNKEYTFFELMEFAASAGFKVAQHQTIISNVRIYYRLLARLMCALKICPVPYRFLGSTYCGLWTKVAPPRKMMESKTVYFPEDYQVVQTNAAMAT